MNANDPLTEAIGEWQRKHHIADGDPMIAALELVRIYLQYSRKIDDGSNATPPSFEDFRSTIELLDRRSKAFVQQATDLIGELRRFGQPCVDGASRIVGIGHDQELLAVADYAQHVSVHIDGGECAARSDILVHGGMAAPG